MAIIGNNQWVRHRNLLTGIVLSLAILDHTRLFFHYWNTKPVDHQHPDLFLFFTRLSAHYFAPAVFLLTGITLYQQSLYRSRKRNMLLWLRNGTGLLLLEMLINNFLYTFDFRYRTIGLFIVGNMGICLVLLSLFQYVPKKILTAIALLILLTHNLLDKFQMEGTTLGSVAWYVLHQQKYLLQGGCMFIVNYTVLPWFALLLTGYLLGPFVRRGITVAGARKIQRAGIGLIVLFFLLRSINSYGDPQPWQTTDTLSGTLISFFNVTKYPASLDYLCITIGPLLLLCRFAAKIRGRLARVFITLGERPLTLYLFSTLLIHLAALVAARVKGFSWHDMIITPASYEAHAPLAGYGFPLAIVYLFWIGFMIVLYVLLLLVKRIFTATESKEPIALRGIADTSPLPDKQHPEFSSGHSITKSKHNKVWNK